jgi:hypothetical protein
MICASKKLGKKVVWIGDQCQLPPVINMSVDRMIEKDYVPLSNGFNTLCENFTYPSYQLTDTYRLSKRAAHFTSFFYNGNLNSVAEKVKAVELVTDSATGAAKADSSIEKVTVEKVTASFDGFVPGVGYSNPTLFRILSKQKVGEWGEAVVTNDGAAMVKILNRTLPDTTAAKNALTEDLANTWRFGYSMLFNEYVQNLEKAANVESNLDLYYRE